MGRKAKFSFDIKIDIVLRCLKGETTAGYEAKRLGIERARVAEWISLYQSLGEDGLRDKRGKRRSPDEMNELEKLRAEIKLLRAEMEISFLKKLEEIERRRS